MGQLNKEDALVYQATGIVPLHTGVDVKQTLYPARDWVLLELEESRYQGRLVIPDSAKDAPQIGHVLAIGPGTPDEPVFTKAGDRVMFTKFSGADVEWDGKSYLLVRESEIICYIRKEEKDG